MAWTAVIYWGEDGTVRSVLHSDRHCISRERFKEQIRSLVSEQLADQSRWVKRVDVIPHTACPAWKE